MVEKSWKFALLIWSAIFPGKRLVIKVKYIYFHRLNLTEKSGAGQGDSASQNKGIQPVGGLARSPMSPFPGHRSLHSIAAEMGAAT